MKKKTSLKILNRLKMDENCCDFSQIAVILPMIYVCHLCHFMAGVVYDPKTFWIFLTAFIIIDKFSYHHLKVDKICDKLKKIIFK